MCVSNGASTGHFDQDWFHHNYQQLKHLTFCINFIGTKRDFCDFEILPALCGYTQSDDDDFDWKLHNGPTASSDTGPSADHSLNSTSMYIFFAINSESTVTLLT